MNVWLQEQPEDADSTCAPQTRKRPRHVDAEPEPRRAARWWTEMYHDCFQVPKQKRWRVVTTCSGMDTPCIGMKERGVSFLFLRGGQQGSSPRGER